jgi:hypothetical protein
MRHPALHPPRFAAVMAERGQKGKTRARSRAAATMEATRMNDFEKTVAELRQQAIVGAWRAAARIAASLAYAPATPTTCVRQVCRRAQRCCGTACLGGYQESQPSRRRRRRGRR